MGIKGLTEPRSARRLPTSAMALDAMFKHGHDMEDEDSYREEDDWLDLMARTVRKCRVDWSKVPEVVTYAELTLFDQTPDRDSPLDIMGQEEK